MKFLSTLLIATWLLCWVQCLTEQSAGEINGCCGTSITANSSEAASYSAPDHDGAEHDCVQGIFAQGLNLTDHLAAIPAVHIETSTGYILAEDDPLEASATPTLEIPRTPPLCLRLWEFMARTATPVRGPTLIA